MKKANTITMRLGLIISGILLFSIVIIFLSMYKANYDEIRKAAGIEAYGCANITTALIDPVDIEKIKAGDDAAAKKLGENISWTVQHKNIFAGQYVMDLDGTLLAADENLIEQGFEPGDSFYISDGNKEQLIITKAPVFSKVYEFGGMKRLTGYAPIFEDHDPEKEVIAFSAIDFESNIIHSRTWDMIKGSFLFAIIPIILAGILTIYLIKRTTDPLKAIIRFANRIAEGDLTGEPLKVKNKDEIGRLSKDLNTLATNFRLIISELTASSSQLAAFSEELSVSGEEISAAAEQNMQSFHQVEVASEDQTKIAGETNALLEMIAERTQEIKDQASELNAISTDTTDKAETGGNMIRNSVQQMELIDQQTNKASQMIGILNEKSGEINDIILMITKISEQTNLLALNASIEASRAGESGKGFAVVANEIRRLAEQSAESTGKISDLIKDVQTDTMNAVAETNESINYVKEGTKVITEAGISFREIKEAIDKETAFFQIINEKIDQIVQDISQIVASMRDITGISGNNTDKAKEVFNASEEQVNSIHELNTLMNNLNELADELNKRTHRFIV